MYFFVLPPSLAELKDSSQLLVPYTPHAEPVLNMRVTDSVEEVANDDDDKLIPL